MNVERCDFITTVLFESPYQHHQDPTEKTQSGIGVGYAFFHASLYEAIIGLEKNLDKRNVGHNPRGKAKGSCQDSAIRYLHKRREKYHSSSNPGSNWARSQD